MWKHPPPKGQMEYSWREGWAYTYIHGKANVVMLMTESSWQYTVLTVHCDILSIYLLEKKNHDIILEKKEKQQE